MRICLDVNDVVLKQMDALVESGIYGARTEILRDGIRRILRDEQPREPFIMQLLRRNQEDRVNRDDTKHE